jgi:hypothetical protein
MDFHNLNCQSMYRNSFGIESNYSDLNNDYWDKLVHKFLIQGAIF